MKITRVRQIRTQSRYTPTRRTIVNHESEEAEGLRGPILTWMAEEAPHDVEEAEEARMLMAEVRLPELHDAVRQLKG